MRIQSTVGFALVTGALASSSLALATPDPFKQSNEAVMARVALELPLGRELTEWLESADDAKVVLVNLEDDHYTDDALPEYMVHDALSARLTDSRYEVRLLDRDPDLMTLVNREQKGLDLPFHMEDGKKGVLDPLTRDQRRYEVGRLIAEIIHEIAPQDVLVTHEASCCADGGSHTQPAHTNIIANEVGTQKAQLLRDLLGDFEALFPTPSDPQEATRHVDLNTADYLVAYRVYDFGNWSFKENRITYIKLHVRVIDMKNAAIVASDIIEHQYEDRLSGKDRLVLMLPTGQSDYGRPATRSARKWRSPDYVQSASSTASSSWDGTTIIERVEAESGRGRGRGRSGRRAAKKKVVKTQASPVALPEAPVASLNLKLPSALADAGESSGGLRSKLKKRKKSAGADSPVASLSIKQDEGGGLRAKLKLKKGDSEATAEASASSEPRSKPGISMPSIDWARVVKIAGGGGAAVFGVTRLLKVPTSLSDISYYGGIYSDPSTSELEAEEAALQYNAAIKSTVINGVLGLALGGAGSVVIVKSISMTPTTNGLVFSGTW